MCLAFFQLCSVSWGKIHFHLFFKQSYVLVLFFFLIPLCNNQNRKRLPQGTHAWHGYFDDLLVHTFQRTFQQTQNSFKSCFKILSLRFLPGLSPFYLFHAKQNKNEKKMLSEFLCFQNCAYEITTFLCIYQRKIIQKYVKYIITRFSTINEYNTKLPNLFLV